ncbi:MAG: glucose 1-dehydrogenase [Chloroflexi bacterium]|nr:glucose 1-dehydrogenase [Chloroflexota bacterium]
MFDLTGKVAIVTGGNGGLGRAMAQGLAEAGANIVIAARSADKNAKAAEEVQALGVKALPVKADVTLEEDVRAMVRQAMEVFGRVDILVNNVGVLYRKQPEELSLEEWNSVLRVNLDSAFLCSREVYPHMKRVGGGKIINIASTASLFGSDSAASYSTSKGGMLQLARSLALAWAKDNIQVNAILPGWFMTEMTADLHKRNPQRARAITQRIPAGRWGSPLELRGVVVFLASPASSYVTGAAIAVDGGYTSGLRPLS